MTERLPHTLIEAVRYFADVDVATEYVAQLRWPEGPVCPSCEGTEHSYLTTRRVWKCKSCKKQFSVKVGTIFEDSPLPLTKWLPCVWLLANSKNGVSSHEAARALGVTQKTAWFMMHRIRLAMRVGSFDRMMDDDDSDEFEADESFVGGRAEHMHADKRERRSKDGFRKAVVAGVRRRDGQVRASVVPDNTKPTLQDFVRMHVPYGAALYTDSHASYVGLAEDYRHESIDHAVEYARGRVSTNGIENFWSLLKRGLGGTYVSVDPQHLERYVDERAFTYNWRDVSDYARFYAVLLDAMGRRLTWKGLTQPWSPSTVAS